MRHPAKGSGLIRQAGSDHVPDAGVDAGVELSPRQIQPQNTVSHDIATRFARTGPRPLPLPFADGPARQLPDLQGPDHSANVIDVKTRRAARVYPRQPIVQRLPALLLDFLRQASPECRVRGRPLEQAVEEGL